MIHFQDSNWYKYRAMEIPKLEEIAAFTLAKHLWHESGAYKELVTAASKKLPSLFCFDRIDIKKRIRSVQKSLSHSLPNLPARFVNCVNAAIECVGMSFAQVNTFSRWESMALERMKKGTKSIPHSAVFERPGRYYIFVFL